MGLRFWSFTLLTAGTFFFIYNAHAAFSYVYYNHCNGLAMASPPCVYLLEMIYLSVAGVRNIWIYLGALLTSFCLYAFNRVFAEIGKINMVLQQTTTANRFFKTTTK
jgi:hypothetical protein